MRDPERDDKHCVPPVCRLDHQLRGQRGSQSGGERRRRRRGRWRGGQKVGGGEQRRVLEDYGEAGPAGERRQRAHQRSACVPWCACAESLKSACGDNKHRRSPRWRNLTRMTHLAGWSSHYSHRTRNICSHSVDVLSNSEESDKPAKVCAWDHPVLSGHLALKLVH